MFVSCADTSSQMFTPAQEKQRFLNVCMNRFCVCMELMLNVFCTLSLDESLKGIKCFMKRQDQVPVKVTEDADLTNPLRLSAGSLLVP